MKPLPTRLDKQTVLDAISEIVFNDAQDIEVLFSKVYSELGDEWEYSKMPVMKIPEDVRKSNSNFETAPHYYFSKDHQRIFIGPRLIAFSQNDDYSYPGWAEYRVELEEFYLKLCNVYDADNIINVTLNFKDFFKELNIFNYVDIVIDDNVLSDIYKDYDKGESYAKLFSNETIEIKINIENKVHLTFKDTDSSIEGSIIEIKVQKSKNLQNIMAAFDDVHEHAKKVFFNLLKESFVKEQLGAHYE